MGIRVSFCYGMAQFPNASNRSRFLLITLRTLAHLDGPSDRTWPIPAFHAL
jgi:hypothetical protein